MLCDDATGSGRASPWSRLRVRPGGGLADGRAGYQGCPRIVRLRWHTGTADLAAAGHPFFEGEMGAPLAGARRVLTPEGIAVFVFAHKTTSGRETMLSALLRAGGTVTGSWPIDTGGQHSSGEQGKKSAAQAPRSNRPSDSSEPLVSIPGSRSRSRTPDRSQPLSLWLLGYSPTRRCEEGTSRLGPRGRRLPECRR
jgi:hypothetical protein